MKKGTPLLFFQKQQGRANDREFFAADLRGFDTDKSKGL
jgi:hypothetical protein